MVKRSGSILSFFKKKSKNENSEPMRPELTLERPNGTVSKLLVFTTVHLY